MIIKLLKCWQFENTKFDLWRKFEDCTRSASKLKLQFQTHNLATHSKQLNDEEFKSTSYPNHIPTTAFHRISLIIGSSIVSLADPRRHDMIAVLGETTGHYALKKIYSSMLSSSEARAILIEKPRINSNTVDLEILSALPENTLGHSYVKFLKDNNVTPDSRLPVKFVNDAELAYVLQRYREVHDLFHTILGMPTNMQGEVAVKWIEALQLGLPMCIGGALFGPLRFKPKQRKNYVTSYLPWAFHVGKNSKPLMLIYFERRWDQNINDLRAELNIKPFGY